MLNAGLEADGRAFVDALLEQDLLESFVVDIDLKDGSQNRLAGFLHRERRALCALWTALASHRSMREVSRAPLHGGGIDGAFRWT